MTMAMHSHVQISDPIRAARSKFESMLADGRRNAEAVIAKIETDQPVDRIARAGALRFAPNSRNTGLDVEIGSGSSAIVQHVAPFAMTQALARAAVPRAYADELLSDANRAWGVPLLAHSMNEIYAHDPGRYLLRSVDDDVRAMLSDRYRRLDSRPIVGSFLEAARSVGAFPLRSFATSTKIAISVVLDQVFQPIPDSSGHEILILGVTLTTSDWGAGPLELRFYSERLVCLNGLTAEQSMRQIHLGGRLGESLEYSQRTYELDTQTQASAVRDLVTGLLSRESLDAFQAKLRSAHEQKLSPQRIGEFLGKSLTKTEKQEVVDLFNSADVVMMPAGQSSYRLAQALGLRANQVDDDDRRLALHRLAGDALSIGQAA